jgi:hypothetical protein
MTRTTPALIPGAQPPTSAELYTYRQAILELQQSGSYAYSWTTDVDVPYVEFDEIPADLSQVRICSIASGDYNSLDWPMLGLHIQINDNVGSHYTYGLTDIHPPEDPAGGQPNIYSQKQLNYFCGYIGAVRAKYHLESYPCATEANFPNWGFGSEDLCYTGSSSSYSTQTIFGGRINSSVVGIPRPYTKIKLFASLGNLRAGSVFTITGTYQ